MSTKISATLKKQFLFKTQQLAELEQKLMEAEGTLNAEFSGIQKKSFKKNQEELDCKDIQSYIYAMNQSCFLFLFYCRIFQRRKEKNIHKYI